MPSIIARSVDLKKSNAESWLRKNPCPDPGSGVHEWLKSAGGSFKKCGLSFDENAQLLADNMTRKPQLREIQNILAFIYSQSGETSWRVERPKLPAFDPVALAKAVPGVPVITKEWLRQHSPQSVDIGPAGFLRAIYQGDHVALVIGDDDKEGNVIWRRLQHVWTLAREKMLLPTCVKAIATPERSLRRIPSRPMCSAGLVRTSLTGGMLFSRMT